MFDHKNLLSIDELSAEDIMTVLTYAKTFEEVNERPIKKDNVSGHFESLFPSR